MCVCVSLILSEAHSLLQCEMSAHAELFPLEKFDLGVPEDLKDKVFKFHDAVTRCSVTKAEFMILKVLLSPSASTADRIGRYAADLAQQCKKDWADLIDAEVVRVSKEYLAKHGAANKKRRKSRKMRKKRKTFKQTKKPRTRSANEIRVRAKILQQRRWRKKKAARRRRRRKGRRPDSFLLSETCGSQEVQDLLQHESGGPGAGEPVHSA